MKSYKMMAVLAFFFLSAAFPGCRGPKIDGLVPVRGTVTYRGKPLEGATVGFSPKEFRPGDRIGVGRTDAKGLFELRTIGEPGVLPNDYLVFVVKNAVVPASPSKGGGKPDAGGPSGPPRPGKGDRIESRIPKRYGNAKTSGLEWTVGRSGLKDVRIELTD